MQSKKKTTNWIWKIEDWYKKTVKNNELPCTHERDASFTKTFGFHIKTNLPLWYIGSSNSDDQYRGIPI